MEKMLIADDEQLMRRLVHDFLLPEGYELMEAADGKAALAAYEQYHPDLILLDVMMPGYDGWTVCRDSGVDEYVTKPFSPKILVAKIKAVFRRSKHAAEGENCGVCLDKDARQVVLDGKNIDLSPTEYKLLNYLMSNTGKALSRRQILNQVWNYDYDGDLRAVDTHINRLRIKLGIKGEYIQTVRGYGYRYDAQ